MLTGRIAIHMDLELIVHAYCGCPGCWTDMSYLHSATGTYSVHTADSTASTIAINETLRQELKFFEFSANLWRAWEVIQRVKWLNNCIMTTLFESQSTSNSCYFYGDLSWSALTECIYHCSGMQCMQYTGLYVNIGKHLFWTEFVALASLCQPQCQISLTWF